MVEQTVPAEVVAGLKRSATACRARATPWGGGADRGHRPRERCADRRLRRAQGRHGLGLLRARAWVSRSQQLRTVRVRIEGGVQGVGYRYWTERVAGELGLAGWVRNRRDGSVEALFSGPAEDVAQMLERCRDGPPSARASRPSRSSRKAAPRPTASRCCRRRERSLHPSGELVNPGDAAWAASFDKLRTDGPAPLRWTYPTKIRSAARRRGAGRAGSARRPPRRAPPDRPCRRDR